MDSLEGYPMGIRQCVQFDEVKSHAVAVDVLGLASQDGDVNLELLCQFSNQSDCTQINSDSEETFILSPDVTPEWKRYEHIMLLPDGTQSATCNIGLYHSIFETPYTFIIDEMKVRDSEIIFIDGFDGE